MRKSTPFVLLAVVIAMAIVACTNAPYTGRNQLILLTQGQEAQMGVDAYQEVKANSKISANARWRDMVARVGERIKAVAERPDFQWEFNVIADPTVNAFCLPGGKVAFYEGIMPVCQTDEGVAVVMGHEVGHAIARHGGERVSQEMLAKGGEEVITAILSRKDPVLANQAAGLIGAGAQYGVLLPYSRAHESEADHIGLILMSKAGYDPHEAPKFWERMIAATSSAGDRPPEFASTHPNPDTRIKQLNDWMPEAMGYYNQAKGKH